MTVDEIIYALNKQLGSAYGIVSSYGELSLDKELKEALDAALRPILERRLEEMEASHD